MTKEQYSLLSPKTDNKDDLKETHPQVYFPPELTAKEYFSNKDPVVSGVRLDVFKINILKSILLKVRSDQLHTESDIINQIVAAIKDKLTSDPSLKIINLQRMYIHISSCMKLLSMDTLYGDVTIDYSHYKDTHIIELRLF